MTRPAADPIVRLEDVGAGYEHTRAGELGEIRRGARWRSPQGTLPRRRGAQRLLPGLPGREPDFVQSLGRGLAVIRAFDADCPALTLSEVARATGLARGAARRFLLTLVELG